LGEEVTCGCRRVRKRRSRILRYYWDWK